MVSSRQIKIKLEITLLYIIYMIPPLSSQGGILPCVYWFAPFGGAALSGNFKGNVAEPAVPGRAVPVLYPGGNISHAAGTEFPGLPAPRLIPAAPVGTQQDLPAALGGEIGRASCRERVCMLV